MEHSEIINPSGLSALALAYIGDAVYEIYVRTRIITENPNLPAHKLHLQAVKYVKAHAQSNSIHKIADMLCEEERAVYKRGRNAKSQTVPKNADLTEYRHATGFEALIGWLYLMQKRERLDEIMKSAYDNALDI
ncbi:MAG: ribonuclease III domain-containing protein [Clostridiales bacterium]|nr:ribonuclease III domain-containing protein [Clostridiales bacterium]